jgi:hypothetical protein
LAKRGDDSAPIEPDGLDHQSPSRALADDADDAVDDSNTSNEADAEIDQVGGETWLKEADISDTTDADTAHENEPVADTDDTPEAGTYETTMPKHAADPVSPVRESHRRRDWLTRVLVLLLILAAAGTGLWFYAHRTIGLDPDVPEWTPGQPSRTPAPSVTVPNGCMPNPKPIDPVLFEVMNTKYSWEMISLGWMDNAAGTPPLTKEGIRQIGWFNEGPWAGSDKGNVILTAHTMVGSLGVGNEINSGILSEGDIVRLSDASGTGVCYQYTHAIKIYVKDYDPASNVLYDNDGPPRLALIACSSEDADTGELSARIIYYFELIGQPVVPSTDSSTAPQDSPAGLTSDPPQAP